METYDCEKRGRVKKVLIFNLFTFFSAAMLQY